MNSWDELDALAATLRAENAAWAERVDALAADAETFGRLTADVDRFYAELGVREAFEALAQRALAGAGEIYEVRRPLGYSRHATLAWRASEDPRAAFAEEPRNTMLTVDVAIGPRLLLDGGGDAVGAERLAVLIMGEKRLLATLPTTPERFRAALLRAFHAPRRGHDERSAAQTAADTADSESAGPAEAPEPAAPAEDSTERAAEAASTAGESAEAGGSAAEHEPQDAPPPEDESATAQAATTPAGAAEASEQKAHAPFKEPPDVIEL